MRNAAALAGELEQLTAQAGREPKLIMLHERFIDANKFYLRSRLHTLCCGRGAIFNGIPCVITSANTVDDFLICF